MHFQYFAFVLTYPTRWAWVWVNSGSWWWTGRPGVLQFMGSQRVGHDWATELNWTIIITVVFWKFLFIYFGCAACWKLSSLTRHWTCLSCFGSVNLNHQTARGAPPLLILDSIFAVDDFLPLLHVCLYWWAFPFSIFFFLVVVFFSTERSSLSICLKLVWFGGAEFS